VNFETRAVSENITIKRNNSFGEGINSTLAINVNEQTEKSVIISGPETICQGQTANYTVSDITNATSYS